MSDLRRERQEKSRSRVRYDNLRETKEVIVICVVAIWGIAFLFLCEWLGGRG